MFSVRNSCLLFASWAIFSSTLAFTFAQVVEWPVAGQGATNLRSQPAETYLGAANAASLIPKWIFTTSGDVSATPTVGTTAVFVPDWGGNLFAIDLATGAQLWSHQISEYDGYAGAVTRVSPALYNASIIIGDSQSTGAPHNGANVIAVNRQRRSKRAAQSEQYRPFRELVISATLFPHAYSLNSVYSGSTRTISNCFPFWFRGRTTTYRRCFLMSGRFWLATVGVPPRWSI